MKTILMPVHDGTITKNLLRTEFLTYLKGEPDLRLVILLSQADVKAYEQEFGVPDKVIIESAKVYNEDDFIEHIFSHLFKHSIPTTFMQVRQVDWYWNEGKYLRYFGATCLRLLGHLQWWRGVLRLANYLEPIDSKVKAIYEKWQPDVVFAPTMLSRVEVALMRLARADKKMVVGMAKSFDNLTSKAFLRIHPDWLIVPNDTGVAEAVNLYDFPATRVVPTGICQYDVYNSPNIFEERNDFFAKLDLDPNKKTILYAPAGDWMNDTDHQVLEEILRWTIDGTLPNTQVLLRLHPSYESKTETLDGHPNLKVERPGTHYGHLKRYEFDRRDVEHLASSLKYADVVINTASTLMVETAIFDTPVIALGFDGYTKKSYWQSVLRYYDREHLVPVMKAGGSKLVKDFAELKSAIKEYFSNPALDREGRKKAVAAVCYLMDGKSCERTAKVLLDAVHSLKN